VSPGFSQENSPRYVVDSENHTASSLPKDVESEFAKSANHNHLLQGPFCSWSGSSGSGGSYSSSKWAKFDGKGRFVYGSSASFSGDSGSMYNNSPDGAGVYELVGEQIFLRYAEGGCDVAKVYFRAESGMVTEILFAGEVYAPVLCE